MVLKLLLKMDLVFFYTQHIENIINKKPNQVRSQMPNQIEDQLYKKMDRQLWHQVRSQINDKFNNQLNLTHQPHHLPVFLYPS